MMFRSTLLAFVLSAAALAAGCKKDGPDPSQPMVPPTTDDTAPTGTGTDPMAPDDGDGGTMPGDPTTPDPMNPDTSQTGGAIPAPAFVPMQAGVDGGLPNLRDGGIGGPITPDGGVGSPRDAGTTMRDGGGLVRDGGIGGAPVDGGIGGARDGGIAPGADGGMRPNPGTPPSPGTPRPR